MQTNVELRAAATKYMEEGNYKLALQAYKWAFGCAKGEEVQATLYELTALMFKISGKNYAKTRDVLNSLISKVDKKKKQKFYKDKEILKQIAGLYAAEDDLAGAISSLKKIRRICELDPIIDMDITHQLMSCYHHIGNEEALEVELAEIEKLQKKYFGKQVDKLDEIDLQNNEVNEFLRLFATLDGNHNIIGSTAVELYKLSQDSTYKPTFRDLDITTDLVNLDFFRLNTKYQIWKSPNDTVDLYTLKIGETHVDIIANYKKTDFLSLDLTYIACRVSIKTGVITDPLLNQCKSDIMANRLRLIGIPSWELNHDGLKFLRAVKFRGRNNTFVPDLKFALQNYELNSNSEDKKLMMIARKYNDLFRCSTQQDRQNTLVLIDILENELNRAHIRDQLIKCEVNPIGLAAMDNLDEWIVYFKDLPNTQPIINVVSQPETNISPLLSSHQLNKKQKKILKANERVESPIAGQKESDTTSNLITTLKKNEPSKSKNITDTADQKQTLIKANLNKKTTSKTNQVSSSQMFSKTTAKSKGAKNSSANDDAFLENCLRQNQMALKNENLKSLSQSKNPCSKKKSTVLTLIYNDYNAALNKFKKDSRGINEEKQSSFIDLRLLSVLRPHIEKFLSTYLEMQNQDSHAEFADLYCKMRDAADDIILTAEEASENYMRYFEKKYPMKANLTLQEILDKLTELDKCPQHMSLSQYANIKCYYADELSDIHYKCYQAPNNTLTQKITYALDCIKALVRGSKISQEMITIDPLNVTYRINFLSLLLKSFYLQSQILGSKFEGIPAKIAREIAEHMIILQPLEDAFEAIDKKNYLYCVELSDKFDEMALNRFEYSNPSSQVPSNPHSFHTRKL